MEHCTFRSEEWVQLETPTGLRLLHSARLASKPQHCTPARKMGIEAGAPFCWKATAPLER